MTWSTELCGLYQFAMIDKNPYVEVLKFCYEYFQYYRSCKDMSKVASMVQIISMDSYLLQLPRESANHIDVNKEDAHWGIYQATHTLVSNLKLLNGNDKISIRITDYLNHADSEKNKYLYVYYNQEKIGLDLIHMPHILFKESDGSYDWTAIKKFFKQRKKICNNNQSVAVVFMDLREDSEHRDFYTRLSEILLEVKVIPNDEC